MKKPSDFKWFVAVTPQEAVSLVAFCPECGSSMTFLDGGAGMQISYSMQQHQCYQKIVSEPKDK